MVDAISAARGGDTNGEECQILHRSRTWAVFVDVRLVRFATAGKLEALYLKILRRPSP